MQPVLSFENGDVERLECAGDRVLHALVRSAAGFGVGVLCERDVSDGAATHFLRSVAASYTPRSASETNFDTVLTSSVDAVNSALGDSRVKRVKSEIDDVIEHLCETTLPALLERHEKIENLVQQTGSLRTSSVAFHRDAAVAASARRRLCFQDRRFVCIVFVGVALLTYVCLAVLCNGPELASCFPKSMPHPSR